MPAIIPVRARWLTTEHTNHPYVALYETMPAEDGTGGLEFNYDNYVRFNAAPFASFWQVIGDEITNIAEISFTASASVSWPLIVGLGFFDAATAGTLYNAARLENSFSVGLGETVRFVPGQIKSRIRLPA